MLPEQELIFSVSEFVSLVNQTFDYAMPSLTITGELANLRVSKGKWVYFDLKDDNATVKFFGTVYMLPGPLEDGMLMKVRGTPRLHQLYGFSVTVQSMQPTGEGTIKRAAELLQAKLKAEGLFDPARKRGLPYPPRRIGLVASAQSAAYADFVKIVNARWGGLDISHIDVQVQGEVAPAQIVAAIEQFNASAAPPEVLIVIRGGGSSEDLAAFSTEQVTRAVAASRVPTLVAIGHEVDISLAELAADQRASTPSNAAELLVPDKMHVLLQVQEAERQLHYQGEILINTARQQVRDDTDDLHLLISRLVEHARHHLQTGKQLLKVLNPAAVLERGFAIVRQESKVVRRASELKKGKPISVQFSDGSVDV